VDFPWTFETDVLQPFWPLTMRQCGDCQLCCVLLPVPPLGKAAGQRCKHQRHHKGCAIHARLAQVVPECRLWNCRWLLNNDTADLSRPDRSHYVLDLVPDFVTLRDDATGEKQHVEVVQIWVDPKHPDAHRDPALRAYLERRAKENVVGLVRWDNKQAMAIFPPELSADGQWHEQGSDFRLEEHTAEEKVAALGNMVIHVAD
jgi:hypothetical protein